MAGSLSHIIEDKTGEFTMDYIENLGDAEEALEECYFILKTLVDSDYDKLEFICEMLDYPSPPRTFLMETT